MNGEVRQKIELKEKQQSNNQQFFPAIARKNTEKRAHKHTNAQIMQFQMENGLEKSRKEEKKPDAPQL